MTDAAHSKTQQSTGRLCSLPRTATVALLGLIIGCAFFLCVFGITTGFPISFQADENGIVKTALRLPIDRFDPQCYYHPSLTYYLLLIPLTALYACVSIWHLDFSPMHFALFFFEKPHLFFFSARLFTALLFCASICLVYRSLQAVSGNALLVLSATALFAFNPALIENHHYALTDAAGVFTTALSLLYFLRLRQLDYTRILTAGAIVGLSLSAKYNAVCLVGMYLLFFTMRLKGLKNIATACLLFCLSAGLLFLALNPYVIIHAQQALSEIRLQSELLKITAVDDPLRLLRSHAVMFCDLFNPPVFVALALSLGWGLLFLKNKKIFCISIYAAASFALFFQHSRYMYVRYYFPIFQALFILLVFFVDFLAAKIRARAMIPIALLLMLAGLYNISLCVRNDLVLLKKSAETEAHEWVLAHIETGAAILTNIHRLQLPETPELIQHRLKLAEQFGTYKKRYYQLQYAAALKSQRPRYRIRFFYDKKNYASNTVKLEEFFKTEDAFDIADLTADPQIIRSYDYLIVKPDLAAGLKCADSTALMASFDNIFIYKILR